MVGPEAPVDDGEGAEGEFAGYTATDDVHGEALGPARVHAARMEELRYLWDRGVYEYGSAAECRERTGRAPLGLKWIDTDKKTPDGSRYRSRLVATEVRQRGADPIFSATPPLEAL